MPEDTFEGFKVRQAFSLLEKNFAEMAMEARLHANTATDDVVRKQWHSIGLSFETAVTQVQIIKTLFPLGK